MEAVRFNNSKNRHLKLTNVLISSNILSTYITIWEKRKTYVGKYPQIVITRSMSLKKKIFMPNEI